MRNLFTFSVFLLVFNFANQAFAQTIEDGCFYCHDKTINKARVIPSIKEKFARPFNGHSDKQCIECHLTHFDDKAPENINNLVNSFPAEKHADYVSTPTSNTYGLCFTCHTEGMLNKNMTDETNFYNETKSWGKRKKVNLHWVHVTQTNLNGKANSGYSCGVCHDVHGSFQPFNVRPDNLPNHTQLQFKISKNGGSCAGSCHSNVKYQRE